jgi:NitT/TauT family transport system substrate-binding protein
LQKGSGGHGLRKYEILIDWQAEPTYLGIYYAKALGLFEEIGLDVTVVQSRGANQAVSAVASGRYPIGTASGGATVLGYNNDVDIVSLGVLYPNISTVVYGLASTGVSDPIDLYGKRIGIYPASITKNEFDAFVAENNLDTSKFTVVSLSGPDIPLLRSGKLDAVLHYAEMSPAVVAIDPAVEELNGHRIFEIPLSEYGVGGYGLNVITSRDSLNQDRELITKVYDAIIEGYRRGCENPAAAVAAFVGQFPQHDREYVEESWSKVCELIGGTYGEQSSQGWASTIELYRGLGLLGSEVEPARILP